MTERAAPTRLPGDALRRRFLDVRTHSTALAAPLSAEDQALQSMPDASPTKWHLAHTTWFFETVVLARHARGYTPFDAHYAYLFNSYYEALGPRHARPQRGLLSRPSLDEVRRYREHVDAALLRLLDDTPEGARGAFAAEIELGLHHEQQHQELILTDILHAFSLNPLLPAYRAHAAPRAVAPSGALRWLSHPGGAVEVGDAGRGFAFDNERPRHPVLLQPYSIGNRLVTNGEYADFIADDGYARPELWLSDGWATVQREAWRAPLYWQPGDMRGDWLVFGLGGAHALDRTAPVAHLSFYEAAAYAEWAQARLPTEFEWEAASILPGIAQVSDSVWQWTRSAYAPYPGFRPLPGIAAEYNGKFMVGQQVLRGGSVATPSGHARPTYRNFFPPAARWQFSGVRLAKDA
ncbi:ergothioneine biosynthesis protein EgtB [Burkholderia sp. FERM BP-3421]|jgi:ergothioneine biosynthesis protein EgtB|uniref:ergothioneine biosynthesis protein EgtB n=1 Tax=Burkholderia sp. FERM BP-3421 TaxID=1494466 RepID=UPI0023618516|nr:ergothioneine biosynthesis protein EgtB [Burkholderia sp. FERM BP-3421]WDD91152.1 ergothioneine biosynthesis protein EgtB [Burkholderia sp. FERM BP-3421]